MKRITLFILLLFTLIGCSTIPVYDVEPLEKEIEYHQGRAISHKETDYYSSWAVYDKSTYNELVFYVTIKNNSNSKILLEPEEFYLSFEKSSDQLFSALDPEREIKELKHSKVSADNDHSISTGLNTFFAAANIAADISDERYEDINVDVAVASDIQHNTNAEHSNKIYNLDNQLSYWQNEVLRKTTLYPEEEISGYVYFIYKRAEDKFTLNIPFENENHSHRFALRELK